jgi:uncharacterized membrane protein
MFYNISIGTIQLIFHYIYMHFKLDTRLTLFCSIAIAHSIFPENSKNIHCVFHKNCHLNFNIHQYH